MSCRRKPDFPGRSRTEKKVVLDRRNRKCYSDKAVLREQNELNK